jgi:hypothetical protein
MGLGLWKRVTLVWLGFFVLAFVNGALREALIKPVTGEPWAHRLSVVTGLALFTAYLWLVWKHTSITTPGQAIATGLYWFVLTVLVETLVVDRAMSRMSWDEILRTYDVLEGELWPLVVVWMGVLPLVMRRVKMRRSK